METSRRAAVRLGSAGRVVGVGGLVLTLVAFDGLAHGRATGAQTRPRPLPTLADTVLSVDFDSLPVGPLSVSRLEAAIRGVESAIIPNDTRIASIGQGNHVLLAYYSKGAVGPKRGGVTFVIRVPPSDEYELRYRVRLSQGFDFREGGKLPGLCSGGGRYSGGRIPRDGDGWSARLTWGRQGSVSAYLYTWEMAGPWGTTIGTRGGLLYERWHEVRQRIRVNSPETADGALKVWIDGRLVLSRDGISWRKGSAGRIDAICFSSFHGGSGWRFAPHETGFIMFDDLSVTRQP